MNAEARRKRGGGAIAGWVRFAPARRNCGAVWVFVALCGAGLGRETVVEG
jgi:hypothetical protein